jgi:hypothetical protein
MQNEDCRMKSVGSGDLLFHYSLMSKSKLVDSRFTP